MSGLRALAEDVGKGRAHLSSDPTPVTKGYYVLNILPARLRIGTDAVLSAMYIIVLLYGRFSDSTIFDTWPSAWWTYIFVAVEMLVAAFFLAVWAIQLVRAIATSDVARRVLCCCCAGWCGRRYGTQLQTEKATRSLSGAALSRATLHAVLATTHIWFAFMVYTSGTAAQALGMLPLYHLACWVVSSRDVSQIDYLTFMHKHHAAK